MNIEQKIQALMIAKDHLEKGAAIMRVEGSPETDIALNRVQCGIDLLKQDILRLQLPKAEKLKDEGIEYLRDPKQRLERLVAKTMAVA